jgi:hypothetical protein
LRCVSCDGRRGGAAARHPSDVWLFGIERTGTTIVRREIE